MRVILVIIASVFIMGLTGCRTESITSENGEGLSGNEDGAAKLSVVATIFPPYDFARNIAGDKAEVTMLVSPGGDAHSYEPTSADILTVRECDVFICGGGESDVWSQEILGSINTDNKKIIRMMDCVNTVEEELTDGMESEAGAESDEAEYDEHVWTSPLNAIEISRAIANAMMEADEENADSYLENLERYIAELEELDEDYREMVEGSAMKPIVFGDRFPFRYLADEFGLTYYAAFPGCSTESDVSAAVISKLIEIVKENDISVVYHIEYSTEKIANTISAETGAESLLLHSCHTISEEDMARGASYVSIMRENMASLEKGLN